MVRLVRRNVYNIYKTSSCRYALKVGAVFIPILGITLAFAVLAVNEDMLVFHYLYALLCCCQSLFVILFYVAFDPKVQYDIHSKLSLFSSKFEPAQSS